MGKRTNWQILMEPVADPSITNSLDFAAYNSRRFSNLVPYAKKD